MKRREFSKKVRCEIINRSMNAQGQITCEGCGLILGKKPFEIDHTIAEGLIIDKTKPLTAKDGQLLGKDCCHRGEDGKTNKDVAIIAKAKRIEAAHLGAKRPKGTIQSHGFPKKAKPEKLPMPGRISLFQDVPHDR